MPDGKASLVQLLALIHNTKISNDFNGMIAKGTATYCICCLTVLNRGKGGGNANLGRLNIPMQPRRGAVHVRVFVCGGNVARWGN